MHSELRKVSGPLPLVLYFALAFGFSWAILVPEALATAGFVTSHVPPAALVLAGFGPAIAALIASMTETGPAGLRSLLGRLLIVRLSWIWYLVASVGPPLILFAGRTLEQLLGGTVPSLAEPPLRAALGLGEMPLALFLPALIANNLLMTLGEETGWRGFALPRMLHRQTPLVSGVSLGVLWGLWHLPQAWSPATQSAVTDLPLWAFFVDITAMSVLYVWVFNHTQGSLVIATLVHASNNTAAVFLMPAGAIQQRQFLLTAGVRLIAVVVVLLFDRDAFPLSKDRNGDT